MGEPSRRDSRHGGTGQIMEKVKEDENGIGIADARSFSWNAGGGGGLLLVLVLENPQVQTSEFGFKPAIGRVERRAGLLPFLAGVKADPGLGLLGRVEQLAQGVEDDLELLAVLTEAVFESIHFAGEFIDRESHRTQADEGVDKFDAHLDGAFAVEDVGSHERPVLGENPGEEAHVAFGCGHVL